MTASPNPIATTHMPFFITAPGETDVLFNVTLVFLVACIILTGVVFLTIHSLPERMAHKSKKILLDLIALLCLLALLTHEHLFWFVAIVLAFIDIPDFLTPVNRIADVQWNPWLGRRLATSRRVFRLPARRRLRGGSERTSPEEAGSRSCLSSYCAPC